MKPVEYYEAKQTLDDGFTVHCGWYRLENSKKRTLYTDGIVYGDHLNVWSKNGNRWIKHIYALYGCGYNFSEQFKALSEGKIIPCGKRIESF